MEPRCDARRNELNQTLGERTNHLYFPQCECDYGAHGGNRHPNNDAKHAPPRTI
jgi:hypothetical protein